MIAISYRREDSTPVAGRLHDRLRAEFGKENVFMDFDSIPYGVDFREHIHSTLERADIVVAVVGPNWLGGQKDVPRRIDDPSDFVRLEIAGALQRGIPVIPVLVDDTPMPKPEALPPDMQAFVFRNALMLDTGIDFHHHADRLVAGIRQLLERVAAKPTATPKEPNQTEPVSQAEATLPGTKIKDQPARGGSAQTDVDLSGAPKGAAPPTEPPKFSWKKKHIAMICGGLVMVAAISLGIVMYEKKRSNAEVSSKSLVAESTPATGTTPVATTAPTIAAVTPPSPSPETKVAQSTAAPIATETVAANSGATSPPSTPAPAQSVVVSEPVHATTPSVSVVDETEAVRQLVRDHFAALSRHDVDSVVSTYADSVDYQGQGHHDRRYIRNDTQNYFRRWDRIYFEIGDIDVWQTHDGEFEAKFNFPFAVGKGYGSDKRGVSSQVWILRKDTWGNLKIISQREKVLTGGSETRRRR